MTTGELDPKIKIRAPLRCAGIGRLDCAENTESGMRMAVRWLPLDANGDAAAKAVTELPTHPTLPKIRQTGRVGSAAYVAMDFPEGRLLSTLLGEPMPVDPLCRMGAEISAALATIHGQGVFHGEMSADSLLLVPGEKAILWDMPLVVANRLTDRRGEERAMSQMVRMAPFLSPERAQGMPPSASSDVYALGAVMCLAAGGTPPATASTLAIIFQLVTGRWSPEVPEGCPAAIRGLLRRMVSRDPLARPSAREVAELLSRPAAKLSTQPEMPAVEAPAPIAGASKKPMRVLGSAIGGLILILAATALYFGLRSPAVAPAPVVAPVVNVDEAEVVEEQVDDSDSAVALDDTADVLSPLVLEKARSAKAVARKSVAKKAAPSVPETPPPPAADDFSFLQSGVEKPEGELKRPSF